MGSHDPFGHLKHKLWPKEKTRFPCVQVACDIPLESSQRRLKLCFRSHLNQRSSHKIIGPQSRKSLNSGKFRIPIWESRDKMSFRCGPCGEAHIIL